ncbi:MAG: Gmad2 immunoglobulin-like domain-containing protein [Patescibacteria group bacterium]|nr:Gmad2 immunoglobulin-like domain-containing protein [Patescibacteria group bacterium]
MLKRKNILKISTVAFLLLTGSLFLGASCEQGEKQQVTPPAPKGEEDTAIPPTSDSEGDETNPPAAETNEMIVVTSPQPGEAIASPLIVRGRARGTWYFEGSFPVSLMDWDGKIITNGYAEAKGEWMTEEFVDFEGTIKFTKPNTEVSNKGTLILRRDNPSGLPENDAAIEIPIVFK